MDCQIYTSIDVTLDLPVTILHIAADNKVLTDSFDFSDSVETLNSSDSQPTNAAENSKKNQQLFNATKLAEERQQKSRLILGGIIVITVGAIVFLLYVLLRKRERD